MTREEQVITLLRTLDVVLSGDGGDGRSDRWDDRLLLLSPTYHRGSYAELERVLTEMRAAHDPIPQWRWHALRRYRYSARRWVPARLRHGRIEIVDGWQKHWTSADAWSYQYRPPDPEREQVLTGLHGGRVLVERWAGVDHKAAALGVAEIARRMRRIVVPPEIMEWAA